MCKYNKLWCDGKAALLRKNQCDQCYRDAVLAMSQSIVSSANGQYNAAMGISSAKESAELLYEVFTKACDKTNCIYTPWVERNDPGKAAWAEFANMVSINGASSIATATLAEQILALNYKEQHEIYKLLYAVNHRI